MAYSNGIVILLLFFLFILSYCLYYLILEDFQQQSSLLYEKNSLFPSTPLSTVEARKQYDALPPLYNACAPGPPKSTKHECWREAAPLICS